MPYFTSYPTVDVPTTVRVQVGNDDEEPPGIMAVMAGLLPVTTPSTEQARMLYVPDLVSIANNRLGWRQVIYNPVTGDYLAPDTHNRMPVEQTHVFNCSQVSAGAHAGGSYNLTIGTVPTGKAWRITGVSGYVPASAGVNAWIQVSSGANSFSVQRVNLAAAAEHYNMLGTTTEILVHAGDAVLLTFSNSALDEALTGSFTYEEYDA